MKARTIFEDLRSVELVMKQGEYTDAFILLYMRFERQCRKLFVWLLVRHYNIPFSTVESLLAEGEWGAKEFINGFDKLSVRRNFKSIVSGHGGISADRFKMLKREFLEAQIRKHRGKIIQGSLTGKQLSSSKLADYCGHLIDWINAVTASMTAVYGYDGVTPWYDAIPMRKKHRESSFREVNSLRSFLVQKPEDIRKHWLE